MRGLHSEFYPASKRYMNDYIQYVKSDFLAGLGFGASQVLGETCGIYIGYNVDTNKNVYIQPALAAQGVKGSVTNALAMAFLGSLGGGKSFANNLICYYAALFGAKALIIDPKSERGAWKEKLPDISEEINIVNLTSEEKNQGLLDPYVIMKNTKDAESLAIDILTFLTGISGRDGKKFPILRNAVRTVTQQEKRGLLLVIKELKRMDTELSREIAEHIESFTDYDFARLLFSDGTVKQSISLDKQINILQVADLVLPDAETSFEEYTTLELLSISMLIIISTFALDFIHSDRGQFKIVDEDEAWAFLQVASGKTLSNKLVRAGRSMNAGVYFVTQNTDDLQDEKMKNNIYGVLYSNLGDKLYCSKEKFEKLDIVEQCNVIKNVLTILKNNASKGDLKSIGIKANGAIRLNNNISEIKKVKSIKLINQSVTGLFEQEIELLNL